MLEHYKALNFCGSPCVHLHEKEKSVYLIEGVLQAGLLMTQKEAQNRSPLLRG